MGAQNRKLKTFNRVRRYKEQPDRDEEYHKEMKSKLEEESTGH